MGKGDDAYFDKAPVSEPIERLYYSPKKEKEEDKEKRKKVITRTILVGQKQRCAPCHLLVIAVAW